MPVGHAEQETDIPEADISDQRLRTPSMIVRDHSGTCVDLALFFAACLELVDIYPVIFLLPPVAR
jgi:hypothetical protein